MTTLTQVLHMLGIRSSAAAILTNALFEYMITTFTHLKHNVNYSLIASCRGWPVHHLCDGLPKRFCTALACALLVHLVVLPNLKVGPALGVHEGGACIVTCTGNTSPAMFGGVADCGHPTAGEEAALQAGDAAAWLHRRRRGRQGVPGQAAGHVLAAAGGLLGPCTPHQESGLSDSS